MSVFDKYLLPKDNGLRRRFEIDVSLYNRLVELTKKYDASVNKLVNLAIIQLIEDENVNVYEKAPNEITEGHNFLIRETSYRKLEELRDKYGLSIYKLVNIAIYNALNSEIEKRRKIVVFLCFKNVKKCQLLSRKSWTKSVFILLK